MAREKKSGKEEDVDSNIDVTKNILNALLKGNEEDHYNYIESKPVRIPSGSILWDSVSPIYSASVLRFCSAPELGKTSQSLLIAKNYVETMKKAKVLYIKSEGRLSEEVRRKSGMRFCFDADSWEIGSVFVLESCIFETVALFIEKLLKSTYEQGIGLCIILDSLDGLLLKKDFNDKEIGEGVMVAGVPKMLKLLMRKIALPVNKYNALMIMNSQVSANIKLNPYEKNNIPNMVSGVGGASALHSCDQIYEFQPRYQKDFILEKPDEKPDPIKNKILGIWCKLEVKKSLGGQTSGYVISYPVSRTKTGNCIWRELEVGDMMLAWGLIVKKGAWLSFSENTIKEAKESGFELKDQIQGLNNLYSYLEENPKICDYFYNKISTAILS